MRKILTAVLTLIIAFTLGACATRPDYTEIDPKLPKVSHSEGRIFFYRLDSTVGLENEPDIFLDDSYVGQSVTGEFFYVDVKPGSHEVRVNEGGGTISFSVGPGEKKYVRTGYSIRDHKVKPKEVRSASWAEDEMSDLKLAGSARQGGLFK